MLSHLRDLWQDDKAALNGWLNIPSSWSAEVMAHQGFDSLTIDLEHGFAGFETALTMIQAIAGAGVTPLARAPWNEPGVIMRLLDAGCLGIICPMVNERAEAERFVGACRYPPQGYRSLGPTRAGLVYGSDYARTANARVITLAMVETTAALANLDAICSTPGLDGVYVGPGDLSLSLGGAQRLDSYEPVMIEALDAILAATRRHGLVAGLHTNSPDYARMVIAKGYRFVTVMTDSGMLAAYARQAVTATRQGMGSLPGASPAAPPGVSVSTY